MEAEERERKKNVSKQQVAFSIHRYNIPAALFINFPFLFSHIGLIHFFYRSNGNVIVSKGKQYKKNLFFFFSPLHPVGKFR